MSRVRVHLNLHRGDWALSVNGKVIEYRSHVILRNVTFYVSEPQRQRSIRLNRRKVHGWAQGELMALDTVLPAAETALTYKPFDCGSFITRDGLKPIARAEYVEFRPEQFINCKGQPYRKAFARGAIS